MKRDNIIKQVMLLCIVPYFFLVFFFCSIAWSSKHIDENKAHTENIMEISTVSYNDIVLESILNAEESMSTVNKRFPIECVRHINDVYRVSYLGEKKVLTIYYDKNGDFMMGRIYKQNRLKDDFKAVHVGMSYKTIELFDPDASYLFLYASNTNIPRQSIHYTEDGYIITISYDKVLFRVIGKRTELI